MRWIQCCVLNHFLSTLKIEWRYLYDARWFGSHILHTYQYLLQHNVKTACEICGCVWILCLCTGQRQLTLIQLIRCTSAGSENGLCSFSSKYWDCYEYRTFQLLDLLHEWIPSADMTSFDRCTASSDESLIGLWQSGPLPHSPVVSPPPPFPSHIPIHLP